MKSGFVAFFVANLLTSAHSDIKQLLSTHADIMVLFSTVIKSPDLSSNSQSYTQGYPQKLWIIIFNTIFYKLADKQELIRLDKMIKYMT